MDNFDLKKYLAYGDGDVVIDISRATPEQERLIRWESDPKNGLSEFDNSEAAQKFADEIMNLNSAKEVKNYYDNIRGWATVDYLDTYKAVNAFVGNKPIPEGKLHENKLSPNGEPLADIDPQYMDKTYPDSFEFVNSRNLGTFDDLDPYGEQDAELWQGKIADFGYA